MKNGYPITNKKDKENHGFGVRSMEHIAKTYGGSMRITTNHQIFRLQLLLAP
jgi:signal transduction histidine kinase